MKFCGRLRRGVCVVACCGIGLLTTTSNSTGDKFAGYRIGAICRSPLGLLFRSAPVRFVIFHRRRNRGAFALKLAVNILPQLDVFKNTGPFSHDIYRTAKT
jgi:hypothetical protein